MLFRSRSDKKNGKKPIDNRQPEGYIVQRQPLPELTEDEKRIMEQLTQEQLVDDLVAKLGLPTPKVLATLTMLQIKGLIRQLPGNRVAPSE